jgi:signal recognition particle receptor subunit beta
MFHDEILSQRQVPIAVFFNKQDLEESQTKDEIKRDGINFKKIYFKNSNIKYQLFEGSTTDQNHTNLRSALTWLMKHMKQKQIEEK